MKLQIILGSLVVSLLFLGGTAGAQRVGPTIVKAKVTSNTAISASVPDTTPPLPRADDIDYFGAGTSFGSLHREAKTLPYGSVNHGSAIIRGNLRSNFDGQDWKVQSHLYARAEGGNISGLKTAWTWNIGGLFSLPIPAPVTTECELIYPGRLIGNLHLVLEGEGRANNAAIPISEASIIATVYDENDVRVLGPIKLDADQSETDLYQEEDKLVFLPKGGRIKITTSVMTVATIDQANLGYAESRITVRALFRKF